MKILIPILISIFLTGCYSTYNSDSVGALKIQEDKETSTYFIFGFGMIKISKPIDTDLTIIRDGGIGFKYVRNTKTGWRDFAGLWYDHHSYMNPESNIIYELNENLFSSSLEIQKIKQKGD